MSKLRSLLPSANSLLVFEAAARTLSFQAAAQEMNVTQPSISHSIRGLEKHLDTKLFHRGNRGVSLTTEGEELYNDLAPALNLIEARLVKLSEKKKRIITVAASTSVAAQWLLPLVTAFHRQNPDVQVRLLTSDRDMEPGHDVDFAILRGPCAWDRPNVWYLVDEILYPICSPAYLQDAPALTTLDDLSSHSILHNKEPYRKRLNWQGWLEELGYSGPRLPESVFMNDYQLVLQACLAGEGIAMGWSVTSRQLVNRRMLVRPLPHEVSTGYAFYVVGPEHDSIAPYKRIFAEWISLNHENI
ncbi:LysR substrate-binding domain-containing protein [Kiloniella sp. b19]|uniref:LysR substrate-binding domain-containing protein n=1 Tax=Kiloniella sp. GXU_MW_B19 TaxID=3141326 RepID=UPI0031E35B5E